MKSRNNFDTNKFLIKTEEINNNNNKIVKTEGNQKLTPKMNNKIRSKSNSKSYNNGLNNISPKNTNHNKNKSIFNQKILEIIKYTEEELGSLDSESHIKSAVKILESFQSELITQLELEYDENSIKKVLQTNFDKIIKLLIKYFTLYDNKCAECISNLKNMLKNIVNMNLKLITTNNNNINFEESSSKSNKKNNNYTSFFDEKKKKEFLNWEETIVSLINSLSGGIKTCNKNYRNSILDMAKFIEESNNSLVELKNKLDKLGNQLKTKYIQDIQYKKNANSFIDNIINDVENLYSMNINIIEDVKLLDTNQTSFYEEAKEIFNHLKINHSKKLKEYHKLFELFSGIQSNINSTPQIIKKRNKSISSNSSNTRKLYGEEKYEEGGRSDGFYNGKNKMNKNNSTKIFNIQTDHNEKKNNASENLIVKENNNNITIYNLAEQVMEFFNKMKNLQESIVKKISGINQLKIDFEKYKKKLIKLLNNIISNKNNINEKDSNSRLINENNNDTITLNNKNNINIQSIKTLFNMNNKIIQVEQFQIINNLQITNKEIDNKKEQILNELQLKYNNLLEDTNNKNQELNELQEKINKLILENNDLNSKNKKLEEDNQKLISKTSNINNNEKKK